MSGPRAAGDHYSNIAATYAAFRPRYTRELFEFVASIAPRRHLAWDCGAGSGQATTDLADYFDEVIATDVSEKQLARAPGNVRVCRAVASAEIAPIADACVDVVTIAQALHWFDHAKFYAEVRRVCVPGGAIAAWTYAAPRMEGDVGRILERYMTVDVGPYWPPERKYVDERYASIPFPFERIPAPEFVLRHEWTRDQLLGYLRSMSATARCQAAKGVDPVVDVERELSRAWPGGYEKLAIEWPLILLAGRVGAY